MIAIINDGSVQGPTGLHGYRVQINDRVICTFKHLRENGLAECLRQAALAVEASGSTEAADQRKQDEAIWEALLTDLEGFLREDKG